MPYRSPVAEIRFILDQVVPLAPVAATEMFAEATGDTVEAILTEAGRLCDEVMAPLNRNGDLTPARLENGVVRTSPGFREGYQAIAEGGWVAIAAPQEFGGMGLPQTLCVAVNDLMSGACLSLQLNPLLTQGQIEALEHHASDEIKDLYLPKLISGEWSGTMNLTEPQAGSDVGALRTKAEPLGDGTYAVTGQKIFISWGDSDVTANICHLVLARLPDAAPGTKGISLFMVPKFIPDANGNPGVANSLKVVSLEHKMGLHGSPTCVMAFDGATGWMVGEPGKGMAAMFTMMNNARLAVGVQGIGIAEGAYQKALEYAQERVQFAPIIEHADVRRMLAEMKAEVFAARSIALACAVALDMGRATGNDDWAARAALLTPIAKAYGTDIGMVGGGAGRAGAWRHGLHRGNRRRAILPRRAGDRDLRRHQRHSGDGPCGPQDDGSGPRRLPSAARGGRRGQGRARRPAGSGRGCLGRRGNPARGDRGSAGPGHAGSFRGRRALSAGLCPGSGCALPPARGDCRGRRQRAGQACRGLYPPLAAAICRRSGRGP